MKSSSRIWVYTLIIALTLIWGNSFVAIKYALRFIGPGQLLVYRYLPVFVLFFIILLCRRGLGLPGRMTASERIRLCLAGLCGVLIYNFALNWGEQHITAGMASLIIALNPAVTYLFSILFLKHDLDWMKVGGLGVSFAGLALLVFMSQEVAQDGVDSSVVAGTLVTIIGPVAWVAYTLLGKPLVRNYSSLEVTSWATLIGALPILLLIRPSTFAGAGDFPLLFWVAIGWLALFCTVIGFIVWYWALKSLGATEMAAFIYLIPSFAILFGRLLLDEPITISLILGSVLIVGGICLVNLNRRTETGKT